MAISRKFLQPINLLNASSDPLAAVKGDIYYNTSLDTVKYYDGSQWNEISGTGTTVSETAPTATSIGEGWFKSSTSELFIWDGTYWVEATSVIQGETLPDQTGNSGKFLSTDGSDTSWQTVDALPGQTGNSGKYLTTDGSIASWDDVDAATLGGQSGSYYTGYADTAESDAITAANAYSDGLASNYDSVGSAATAESNANSYADTAISTHNSDTTEVHGITNTADLATKTYVDTAESDAVTTSSSYSDSLATNYDPAGSASTAESNANTYTDTEISTHNSDTTNVHGIADTSTLATKTYADNAASTAAANLIDSAPGTLDTLNELAAALGDDPNFATTVSTALGNKQPIDADLTAIAALAGTSGFLKKTAADTWSLDTNSYISGNQTITLTGDASGSGTTSISVTVADDSHNHIISNIDGLQTALNDKAPIASPALTGIPTAPTASAATNTTQIATTAYVKSQGYSTTTGTVTSVNISTPTGLSISGNPVNSSGTLALSLAAGYEIPQSSAIVHIAGTETITGTKTVSSELRLTHTGAGQARMVKGDYGVIFRNDGSSMFMLATASGDQYGSWNSLRPFSFNVATGLVTMSNGVSITGNLTVNGVEIGAGGSSVLYQSSEPASPEIGDIWVDSDEPIITLNSNDFMPKSGGTFTGAVSGITPTLSVHLATKEYVDNNTPAPSESGFNSFFLGGM